MALSTTSGAIQLPDMPRLTTTVPKEYVHRATLAEVFLTGCTAREDLRFSLTGQWPRAHTLFNSADGRSHDPLQVAETFRQAGMFLAHAELGVPLGHHFVMWNLNYTTYLENLHIGACPTDYVLHVKCTEIVRTGRRISQLRMEFGIRREDTVVAHGTAHFSAVTPPVYARLRANRPRPDAATVPLARPGSAPMTPASVGRNSATDVVLTPTDMDTVWLLTPDLNHPIFFDHAGDHLPGMVLLEAARQAACALTAPATMPPASMASVFQRYAELDRPCWIEVTRRTPADDGTMTVEVVGRQDGETVFTTTITGPVQP
ncbi:ScbA/BarX family gamma-butyrolactone biosynthesis protein [Streptomyces kunmingensis]|uniref:ScbA/BarX family gamma-butyrolactone biosynthesis protein n=1 Tax=Streptomyces kunmingensis TaxID=68225 RepID=A0ABU6CA05_9ACTN|nr:ScbA/BarX family gamma-butyrolactone biosynthesis protein [Streptomyces kunmingensis]MEB3960680.1 ScbA/BarX family gamma-butyrolactone biosynthesis protein [Streptomyces kunmingensis]